MPAETTISPTMPIQRPLFLTILCVIALIGSLGGIIQNASSIFKAEEAVNKITAGNDNTQIKNIFHLSKANQPENEVYNLTPENFQKFSIGGVVASLLCVVGCILMLRLMKSGFYSFTLGTFFNILTHFLLFGDNIGIMGLSVIAAIGGLVMVGLFSTQLKYLRGNDD